MEILVISENEQLYRNAQRLCRNVVIDRKKIKVKYERDPGSLEKHFTGPPPVALVIIGKVNNEGDQIDLVHFIRHTLHNHIVQIILLQHSERSIPPAHVLISLEIHHSTCIEAPSGNCLLAPILSALKAFSIRLQLASLRQKMEIRVRNRTRDLENEKTVLQQSMESIREDLEAGRHLQYKMLPEKRMEIGEYQFSRALLSSSSLSGDFLDYFEINENAIGFYIADVSGHGISSAFFTVLLTNFMHTFLRRYRFEQNMTILKPALLLRELNKQFLQENLGKYLTMFYGIINRKERKLAFSNAGQFPYPIVYSRTNISMNLIRDWQTDDSPLGTKYGPIDLELDFSRGRSARIQSKGPPLGLFIEAKYREFELRLPDEFLLLMISDGILETLKEESLEKKLAFLDTIVNSLDIEISEILEKLSLDNETSIPDDITFLMIKREIDNG